MDHQIWCHFGDNMDLLAQLPDNSVDSIVTDPPYGLGKPPDLHSVLKSWVKHGHHDIRGKGFMGKEWDAFVPQPAFWKECLRVLKPGGHLLAFAGTRTQHLMATSIQLAGFEIRDMTGWIFGCYSEDTECLTDSGWKNYKDIKIGKDRVLQWDSAKDEFSWHKPKKLYVYDGPKTMVNFANKHTNQLLTENHRVYLKYVTNTRYQFKDYDVVEAGSLKQSWKKIFPVASNLLGGKKVEYPYMIGWWLTDAWPHKDGKACMFSQSKPTTLSKLRQALDQSDCSYSEYTKVPKKDTHNVEHTFYVTGYLSEYLKNSFPTRELSYEILTWDYECRFALLEGLLDGDGSRRSASSQRFWSKNTTRLDIVSALCASLGIRTIIDYDKGVVHLARKSTTELCNKHPINTVKYKGKVWCLTTATGAFLVRRNGKPFISGNSGFPKSQNVAKAINATMKFGRSSPKYLRKDRMGKKYKPTGQKDYKKGKMFESQKSEKGVTKLGKAAKQWDGWGTALKPALEPITIARKPIEGTVAQNVLQHGTGAINIDGCRVPYKSSVDKASAKPQGKATSRKSGKLAGHIEDNRHEIEYVQKVGRWPANLIHDGSQEAIGLFPASNGQQGAVSGTEPSKKVRNTFGQYSVRNPSVPRIDTGSAARFFYCAKTSRQDRNEGLESLPDKDWSKGAVNAVRGDQINTITDKLRKVRPSKNNHVTVKPTSLMRYLCRLVTPPNGIVLDPFMGSGSTGKAAILEGYRFIGAEQDYTMKPIVLGRLAHACKQHTMFGPDYSQAREDLLDALNSCNNL